MVGDFTIIIITKQHERNSPFVHQACVVLHQVFAEGTKEAEALVGERLRCKHKPLQHREVQSHHVKPPAKCHFLFLKEEKQEL